MARISLPVPNICTGSEPVIIALFIRFFTNNDG